jgi:hypothetical protein
LTDLLGLLNLYLIINISFISEVCIKVVFIHHNVVLMKLSYVFVYWICFLNYVLNFGVEDNSHVFYIMLDMFPIWGLTIRVRNLITVELLTVLSLVCAD